MTLVNTASRTCYKPLVTLPAETDVAIIGGGFAGCATAWALAARGVGSVILEREAELDATPAVAVPASVASSLKTTPPRR